MNERPEKKVRVFRACNRNLTLVIPGACRNIYTLLSPGEARKLAGELMECADERKQESEGA